MAGTPLNGPRALARAPNGDLYLALREGNAVYRIDARSQMLHRVAGTGAKGYAGDGGPALEATLAGPKGLAYTPDAALYIADTENHAIRRVDLTSGMITTVLGTGQPGDGPEPDPRRCQLSRPHGLLVTAATACWWPTARHTASACCGDSDCGRGSAVYFDALSFARMPSIRFLLVSSPTIDSALRYCTAASAWSPFAASPSARLS